MLDDNDINKYLAQINKSKAERQDIQHKFIPNSSISSNKITIDRLVIFEALNE